MSSANPYAAPQSDVNSQGTAGAVGSVEDALAGRYDFQIGEVLREAWHLTYGFKLTWWVTYLVMMIGSWVVSYVIGLGVNQLKLGQAGAILLQVITLPVSLVLAVGMVMQVVRRAAGLRADIGTAFSYFDQWLSALGAGILMLILIPIGCLLFLIPGIYLAVAWCLAYALVGDRKMGPWQALETSRKAVTHKWGKVCLTGLASILLASAPGLVILVPIIVSVRSPGAVIVGAIIAIIPMFWTMPWLYMVGGVLYRRIFGVASTA